MPPAEFIALLTAAGWLALTMSAAVLGGAPRGLPPRAAAGIIACGLLRTLAAGLAAPGVDAGLGLLASMAFWEGARQWRNLAAARRVSGLWHLVPLELFLLVGAVDLGLLESARPAWFWPVEAMLDAAPAAFAVVALLWWWQSAPARGVWRAAGLAMAFASLTPVAGAWAAPSALFLAWLAAGGFGAVAFADPAVRSRPALALLAGFTLAVVCAPLGAGFAAARADRSVQSELAGATNRAAASLRHLRLPELGSATATSRETGRELWLAADDLRSTDSALRASGLWRLRDGRIERLNEQGLFVADRFSTPGERTGVARGEPFVIVPEADSRTGAVTAHAPLRVGRFESPPAWLAQEYPAAVRTGRIESARRSATAGLALLAALCAGMFVLVARQAREAAQRGELEQARAADRAKTEFLAFLGHELRTPLQVILGRAEQLAADGDPAARNRAIAAIAAHGRLMLRLVNDLLDLGTLEAGRLVLQPELLSLRRLVATAEETARAMAARKHLACDVRIDPALPDLILADESRLLQVLGNLLGNAVKYTATGGIGLSVEGADSGRMRFRVRDTGIGLPPDKITLLFTLFTRLDSGATFTREGTGVGLALVKRLVDLLGGTVAAANRADGPGAEFTVELPLEIASGARPPAAVAPPVAIATSVRLRVLVAEDHPSVGELLADNLRSLGHEPVVVTDGSAALSEARAGGFDAVLLDINLPRIDGIALARELAALAPRPRLIGCSAEVLPETRAAALAAGMDDFLAKPVRLGDLRQALAPASQAPRDLFAALREPATGARTRELALAELPKTRAALAAARARGDRAEAVRLAHYLKNTALVLGDTALAAEAAERETDPA